MTPIPTTTKHSPKETHHAFNLSKVIGGKIERGELRIPSIPCAVRSWGVERSGDTRGGEEERKQRHNKLLYLTYHSTTQHNYFHILGT
jgi:hypothetical protein